MLGRLAKIVASLRLTVVLLGLGLVLVFWGTMAQVQLGLYRAQNEFFRSFFVYWTPAGTGLRLPIFPGGYLIGGLLLVNLLGSHLKYYRQGGRKVGMILIHLGVMLLLIGQLLTDVLSTESMMHLRNGETKNYSEASSEFELAVVDSSDPAADTVAVIPESRLLKGGDIPVRGMPLGVRVKVFHLNSSVTDKPAAGYEAVGGAAEGAGLWWRALPHETAMERRDMPSGLLEVLSPDGSLGSYLVSAYLPGALAVKYQGRQYQLEFRLKRYYQPFSVHLVEFRHDVYPGTDIPKNFSSRVRVRRADTGEDREVLIYMNNPLRYGGETYYQASFDTDNQGTVLQVVRNPSWLTPYFSCLLVGVGLTIQFASHLARFAAKRRRA